MMGKSDEHMRKGFELILGRPCSVKYFDTLNERGFFDADRNPAPVRVEREGHFQIPYWKALDYLGECAKWASTKDDLELAKRIMRIIRSVSLGSASSDAHDNYHTYRIFSEILGLLPIECVGTEDLALVEGWLSTRFDRSLVVHSLDGGVLKRFLDSEEPAAWEKAVQVIGYCTAVRWQSTQYSSDDEQPRGIVDEYWLKELIDHHTPSLGRKIGCPAAELFAQRVRDVFGRGGRAKWSHVFRPAVEDDGQNIEGRSIENCVVVGLRDLLLAWCDHDSVVAKRCIEKLLRDENEMCRRIAIFVLNRRWDYLRELYRPDAITEFLSGGHLHELYGLIRDHFEDFSACEKAETVEAIRSLPQVEGSAPELRERFQHRWLSATAGTTYVPAAEWLAQLNDKYARDLHHPDYLSYSETRWGPGPSKYSVQELVSFARERTIAMRLTEFEPGDMWNGPTVEGLIDELERAVALAPDQFVYVLPEFLEAPREYQYGLINGFLKLWRNPKEQASPNDWDDVWHHLFKFFKQLLQDQRFWNIDDYNLRWVQPSWISNAIADLLNDGTRDDERAYPSELLPNGWHLIQILVERGERIAEPIEDPMNQSINSSKGRALQAAFGHILRRCRLADKEAGCHAKVWSAMRCLFDRELARCVGENFEFSTLCAARFGNLEYIDQEWLKANIRSIFPLDQPTNLRCAVGGLAYASANRRMYRMLKDKEIIDSALRIEDQDHYGREKLMERLMLGYLWEEDSLQSSRFSHLFQSARPEDFEWIHMFFRSIRRETLKPKQVERIVAYWRYCIMWAQQQVKSPTWLLSGLSVLTSFLTTAEGCRDLLLAVAPHVRVHHETYEFINELNRLVRESPAEVCDVLASFVETHEPFYDYEGRMRALITSIAELGHREAAIGFCKKLRSMAGMETLFNELTEAVA